MGDTDLCVLDVRRHPVSHILYEHSDVWAGLPNARRPTESDVTGLALQTPDSILDYIYWRHGVQGPKSEKQATLDARMALVESVHILSHRKVVQSTPTVKEWNVLKKRKFKHRKHLAPSAVVIRLSDAIRAIVVLGGICAIGASRKQTGANWGAFTRFFTVGAFIGLANRRHADQRRAWRNAVQQVLRRSANRDLQAAHILKDVGARTNKRGITLAAGPYWVQFSETRSTCEWLNAIIHRMWPFLDVAVCELARAAIDPILANAKPAYFSSLKVYRLKFGSRCPEISSIHFSHVTVGGHFVLNANLRFAADDLQAVLSGTLLPAGRVLAGVKNLRISAAVRIALCQPCGAFPCFSAIQISFLEPLKPEFALKLSTGLLPENLSQSVIKPILINILRDKVFQTLFVWPNRLTVPLIRNEKITGSLTPLYPRVKGLLFVQVIRAVHLRVHSGLAATVSGPPSPVATASVDGLHWYTTHAARHTTEPVWRPAGPCTDVRHERWQLVLPQLEHDLTLRLHVLHGAPVTLSDNTSSRTVLGKLHINLRHLLEGEALEGWFRLLSPSAQPSETSDIELVGGGRLAFNRLQRRLSPLVGERVPAPAHPHLIRGVPCLAKGPYAHPLPQLANFLPTFHEDGDADDDASVDADSDLGGGSAPARRRVGKVVHASRPARRTATTKAFSGLASALRRGAAAPAAPVRRMLPVDSALNRDALPGASGLDALAPHGAIKLRLCGFRSDVLKGAFGLRPPIKPAEEVARTLTGFHAAAGGFQNGCFFLKVHSARNLDGAVDPLMDCYAEASVEAAAGTGRQADTRRTTPVAYNSCHPVWNTSMEWFGVTADACLRLRVINASSLRDGRLFEEAIGEVSLGLQDVARYPNCEVREVMLDLENDDEDVTGSVKLSLHWVPLDSGAVPPPTDGLKLLRRSQRGDVHVRVVRAWDLPPYDSAGSCNACVHVLTSGVQWRTRARRSMFPVWVEEHCFEQVSELAKITLILVHEPTASLNPLTGLHELVTKDKVEEIGCCVIDVEDLARIPNNTVLVTKHLLPVGLSHASSLVGPSTASLPRAVPSADGSVHRPATPQKAGLSPLRTLGAASDGAASAGTPRRGTPDSQGWMSPPPARRTISSLSGTAGSSPFEPAAAAEAPRLPDAPKGPGGTLRSDTDKPVGIQTCGRLMFEVIYKTNTGTADRRHPSQVVWPSLDVQSIKADANALNAGRKQDFASLRTRASTEATVFTVLKPDKKEFDVPQSGNCIRLTLRSAANVPRMDTFGRADPYVVVTAQSKPGLQMFKSSTIKNTLAPVWNEAFDVWSAWPGGGRVELQLWDDDRFAADELIGTAVLDVGALLEAHSRRNGDGDGASSPADATGHSSRQLLMHGVREIAVHTAEVRPVESVRGAAAGAPRTSITVEITWVPEGWPTPWGPQRCGRPLVPWRGTALTNDEDGAGPAEAVLAPTPAARGTVTLHLGTIAWADDSAGSLHAPKYLSVSVGSRKIGHTAARLHSRYDRVFELGEVTLDDVLVVKLKGRTYKKYTIGRAATMLRSLVSEPATALADVPHQLVLHGAHAVLQIRWSWTPL